MPYEDHAAFLQWLNKSEEEWLGIPDDVIRSLSSHMMHRQAGREPYLLFVPQQYPDAGSPRPLLVMLHGCDQSAVEFAESTKMNWLADKEGFLVLYPNINFAHHSDINFRNGMQGWNWWYEKNQERGSGEAAAIADMIHDVEKAFPIDCECIYIAGISAGAAMAVNMAVAYPDLISGVATVAGLEYKAFSAPSGRADEAVYAMTRGGIQSESAGHKAYLEMKRSTPKPVPLIAFQGMDDRVVHRINTDKLIEQWQHTNLLLKNDTQKLILIEPDPLTGGRRKGRNFERRVYPDSTGTIIVEKWYIIGMEHAWPGGSRDRQFSDPDGPSASLIMWHFFQTHRGN